MLSEVAALYTTFDKQKWYLSSVLQGNVQLLDDMKGKIFFSFLVKNTQSQNFVGGPFCVKLVLVNF